MKQDTNRKITVEDLLSLKRAERPPAEFWASFESELRAKQLAAIVGKRSWRDALPRIFTAVYRYHLPFGAVAALALTWAGIHYSSESVDAVHSVPLVAPKPSVHSSVSPAAPAVQAAESPDRAQVRAQVASLQTVSAPMAVAASRASEAPASESPKAAIGTRFSDVVAATLADFRENQPELARRDVFSSDREFETSVESMRQAAAEPLARLDPAAEERNARLLATALPAYGSSNSAALASARVRERESNDRMYESMDPYGSSGQMSLEIRF